MNVNGTTGQQHHEDLSIHVHVLDDIEVFELTGSLDIATSPTVRAALTSASERGGHQLIVDLTQVDFLDSTGLGALIGGSDPAAAEDHRAAQGVLGLSDARRRRQGRPARRRLIEYGPAGGRFTRDR